MRARFKVKHVSVEDGWRRTCDELCVTLAKREALSVSGANWVISGKHEEFARLALQRGGSVLRYDIEGLRRLDKILNRRTDAMVIWHTLVGMARAIEACSRDGFDYYCMLYSKKHVFISESGRVRFVFLPVDGMRLDARNSPMTLLKSLCEVGLKDGDANINGWSLVDGLMEFVRASQNVFDYAAFRGLLARFGKGDPVLGEARMPDKFVLKVRSDGRPKTTLVRLAPKDASPSAAPALKRVSDGRLYFIKDGAPLSIGRATDCEIRITDNLFVSRRHAIVTMEDDVVKVRDAGSSNGCFVDGIRVGSDEDVQLRAGNTLNLGGTQFVLIGREL